MVLTRLDVWITNPAMEHHMLLPLLRDARKCIADQAQTIQQKDSKGLRDAMYREQG
jgi:hypothetical protein